MTKKPVKSLVLVLSFYKYEHVPGKFGFRVRGYEPLERQEVLALLSEMRDQILKDPGWAKSTEHEILSSAQIEAEHEVKDEMERASKVTVGNCPKCSSPKIIDCEEIEEPYDPTVGKCNVCGYFWCLGCDSPLSPGIQCGHCYLLEM